MLEDLQRARIVITNYHALRPRERLEVSSGGRALLQGRGRAAGNSGVRGPNVQRVMPELMALKNVMVLNDEGHHCYRHKPGDDDEEGPLTREDRQEADRNNEEAQGMDFRLGDCQPQAGREPGGGPVGHAVLSAGIGLRRGNAVPVDGESISR